MIQQDHEFTVTRPPNLPEQNPETENTVIDPLSAKETHFSPSSNTALGVKETNKRNKILDTFQTTEPDGILNDLYTEPTSDDTTPFIDIPVTDDPLEENHVSETKAKTVRQENVPVQDLLGLLNLPLTFDQLKDFFLESSYSDMYLTLLKAMEDAGSDRVKSKIAIQGDNETYQVLQNALEVTGLTSYYALYFEYSNPRDIYIYLTEDQMYFVLKGFIHQLIQAIEQSRFSSL